MKKLAFLTGAAGLGLAALLVVAHSAKAADRRDSIAALGTMPLADINDVYAWMSTDGSKVNLAMTISPADDGTRHFGPGVQYVFHVTSKAMLGVRVPEGTETNVICTFASDTSAQCWVAQGTTVKGYVTGDASNTAGIISPDGKVRLFAGRRSDPFFFNFQGFRDAVAAVKGIPPALLTPNAAGCPSSLTVTQTQPVIMKLQEPAQPGATAPCATDSADCFAHLNVLAIVLQIDKSLLNAGTNTTLGIWGSSHMGS